MRILIVEDDECIAKALLSVLGNQHYIVDLANDGISGWELIETCQYDLILLDVMLPKLDGIKICQRLRSKNYQTPILLLTAKDSNTDKVEGLEAGADDYVVKPFEFSELLARIRVLLRRRNSPIQRLLQWENLCLYPDSCEVTYNDNLLTLTPKEYRLLELFLRNKHQVFSRSDILDHLWSIEEAPKEDTVTAHIKGLRHKLSLAGAQNDCIETVYGIGYRLKETGFDNKKPSLKVQQKKNSQKQQMKSALTELWQNLKSKTNERLAVLQQTVTALTLDELAEEQKQQAQITAHKLAGILGVFGLAEGSRLAKQIEQMFQRDISRDQNTAFNLLELVELLEQELNKPVFEEFDKAVLNFVEEEDSVK
jgi:DNA-binding response OmpR family regulator/HPt (histidine-containing phosphotransfer) domain-containing protein